MQKSKIYPIKSAKDDVKQFDQVKNQKYSKGVTLIELIIVLAVFSLILGTTASIFISILNNQNRVFLEQELSSQVSYVAEYVSMSIQEAIKDNPGNCLGKKYKGYNYVLTHFDSTNGFYQGIKFIAKDGACQEFFLDSNFILKEIKNSNEPQNILSDKFDIKYARFIINGDKTLQKLSDRDSVQPRITFVLDVQNRASENQQEKIIQTTVSQRNLNIQ